MRKSEVKNFFFYRFEKKGFCNDSGMSCERGEPCGTRGILTTALKCPHVLSRREPPRPRRGRPPRFPRGWGGWWGEFFSMDEGFKFGFVERFRYTFGDVATMAPSGRELPQSG